MAVRNHRQVFSLTELRHLQAKKLAQVFPKAKHVFISRFIGTQLTAKPIL